MLVFLCLHQVTQTPGLCVCFDCGWWRPELWHFGLPPQEHFRLRTARSLTRASTSAWQSTAPGLATRLQLTFMFEVRSLLTPADPSLLPFRAPPPAVRSSLVTSAAPMLCLLAANKETGFNCSENWTCWCLSGLCSHTVISCTLCIPVCLVFVSWGMIYVFCSTALLLVCLTCLTS